MRSRGMEKVTAPAEILTDQVDGFVTGFWEQLPNIAVGIVFLVIAWIVAGIVAKVVRRIAVSRDRPDLGSLLGSIAKFFVLFAAFLAALAIIFPSIKPADVFATLGIGSVAVGFAFKDILQNMLAGLLLLIRRPYQRGDQIIVKEFEGTVQRIETRATIIRTYDGKDVIIPNADIYTSAVIVNTAHGHRRGEYVVGIGYGDDIDMAKSLFLEAIRKVDGVLEEPAPQVIEDGLNESTVDLKLRWWANSSQSDQTRVRSAVINSVYKTANEHGIDMPFPTQVILYHDQTEEADGNREKQREGWPAPPATSRGDA